MNIQREIARFIAGVCADELSPELVAAARKSLLDTLAAALVGSSSEVGGAMLGYLVAHGGQGRVPILGAGITASPDRAALVNGTLVHAPDFDDTVSSMPGHPGAVIVPALTSALDGRVATGREFLAALVVGYEVATKLGRAIGMGHYNRGWHSTGTIGIFGAVAAVAHLMRLDEDRTVHALGIATSMASGLRVNFGTMTKPLHTGWAASAGLTGAQLAASGFTASEWAMNGFFETYGTAESDPGALLLGSPYTMLTPGIGFKKYPCCYAMHRAIDALEEFRREGVLDGDVVKVSARVAPGVLRPLPYSRPKTGLEAKFSMEYALAVGIVDGDFSLQGFSDEAAARPAIRAALERTEVREDPECSPGDPEGRLASAGTRGFVEVAVETADGRLHVKQVTHPPGSPQRPLSTEEIRNKFLDCARYIGLAPERTERVLNLVNAFEQAPDAAELIELLAEPGARTLRVPAGDLA